MNTTEKRRRIIAAAVFLAALIAVFLIVYHLPGKIEVTVRAAPISASDGDSPNACSPNGVGATRFSV